MRLRIALATAVVSLALPALASADTYCVNKSPCLFGASKSTVQDALVAAAQNPGPDVVRIGARAEAYEGPFSYDESAFNPVQIIGDGPGQTVLASSSSDPVLSLGQGGSKVSGVTFRPWASGGVGLELLGGDAEDVSVEFDGALYLNPIGVVTRHDAELRNITVDMSAGTGVQVQNGPQGTVVQGSSISARNGLSVLDDATATLRDVHISAVIGGAGAAGGHLRLNNVLVTTSAPDGLGVAATDGSITGNHVTIGRTAPATNARGVSEHTGSVSLNNTIINGYPVPILRGTGNSGGVSDLSVRYSNFDQATSLLNVGTVAGSVSLGPGIRNEDPHFAAPGDFHLRGDSKLIDAGEITSLSGEEDIEGLDRDKDGDGDSAPEVDLGAYEYQRRAPVADFSVGPGTAGAPVAFASLSSDPDPGDESGLNYSWTFGDGGSASGPTPEHVYAQPGDYTVILSVTDPNGQGTARTRVVSVAAASAGGDSGPGGSSSADVVAPVISGLRVAPRRLRLGPALARLVARGGQIRFRLSEPARVTLRFDSARSGWRGGVLRVSARAGLNTVRFAGRLSRRRSLRPGAYRLTVLAKDAAGNAAKPQRTGFALMPRAAAGS